jgi:CheY-like chemotaxis protein
MSEPDVATRLSRTVLYAEDEENDVFLMQHAFSEADVSHELKVVRDGDEAIEYLRGAGDYADRQQYPLPCLLLLDLRLPKKTGMEVLKWIRNETSVSTLPVIVLTSHSQDADVHRAYVQGANAFLVKPSSPAELTKMVKTIDNFWLSQNRTSERSWNLFQPK